MTLMKHPSMQDVAVHIVDEMVVPTEGEDWIYLNVLWYNIHGNKHFGTDPYLIDDEFALLKLPLSQYKQWVPYAVRRDT